MVPFYEHVAEGLKAKHPDLVVSVEAIPLREHEKRVALGLSSGAAADVIELGSSTAARYLENDSCRRRRRMSPPSSATPRTSTSSSSTPRAIDGTVYGVPLFRGQSALYYNVDMFEAAGLTKPPPTMEEFTTMQRN